MEDDYNLQVHMFKNQATGAWEVKSFLVLHQGEPWSFRTFKSILECICHLHNDTPPETFIWPYTPKLKIKIIKN
jgi:hypothetical protein